jgi:hypothetical protein
VEEFTGNTGRMVFGVTSVANSPAADGACAALWTAPSRRAPRGVLRGSITINAKRAASLHVPVTSADVQNQRIAW